MDRFPPTLTPPMTKAFRALVDRAAHLEQAKLQQKAFADVSRRDLEFSVSDRVWVSTRCMAERGIAVFAQRYIGPVRIIEHVGKAAYKLDFPPPLQVHPVFHVPLLTAEKPRLPEKQGHNYYQPVDEVGEGRPAYEVEHILDQRGEGPICTTLSSAGVSPTPTLRGSPHPIWTIVQHYSVSFMQPAGVLLADSRYQTPSQTTPTPPPQTF